MNKFKEGQRVKVIRTGKIGRIAELDYEDFDEAGCSISCYKVYYVQEDNFDWFTVHDLEPIKEILNAEEREYLSNVIKPFRDRVENIKKFDCCFDMESIVIYIKDFAPINLPDFKKNTMYQNMELDERYTLEELEL